jgi:hypothetical protein
MTSKHSRGGRRWILCGTQTGLVVLRVDPSSSDSVRCTRRAGRRSISTHEKMPSTVTAAVGNLRRAHVAL